MNYSNNWKNKKARKRILLESLVAFLILLCPFIFKSHEYFPSEEGEVVEFWFFTVGANGFSDVSVHVWFLLGKLIPLYLLLIWFFTCKHWWYHIILIPITMYSFQIFELYASEDVIIDSENLLWLLPICMIVIPIVYLIRIKLYDKHVHGIDLKAMNEELTVLREKEELRKEKEKLEKRKERLKNMGGVGVEAFDADDYTPAGSTEDADELPIPTGNYELSTDLPEPIKEALETTKEVQNKTAVAPVDLNEKSEQAEATEESSAEVVLTSSSKTFRETRKERRQRLAREREQAQNASETEKSEKDHPEAKKM